MSTAGRQLCRGRTEKFVVDVAILRVQVSVSEFLDEVREWQDYTPYILKLRTSWNELEPSRTDWN